MKRRFEITQTLMDAEERKLYEDVEKAATAMMGAVATHVDGKSDDEHDTIAWHVGAVAETLVNLAVYRALPVVARHCDTCKHGRMATGVEYAPPGAWYCSDGPCPGARIMPFGCIEWGARA